MPARSSKILIIGAAQLVVQDALEIIASSFFKIWWLIPMTTEGIFPLAGADIMTFFAPACKCLLADSLSLNKPVLSNTISISNAFQGNADGSFSANTFIFFPLIIIHLTKTLQSEKFIKKIRYIHPDSAAARLSKDLGEDFISFLGYNPLMPVLELKLIAGYAHPDSLKFIEKKLSEYPKVKEVYYEKNLLITVHENIKKIGTFLLAFSVIMFIIAFALIDSSIRLSIYSKRFIIRTMQLVGATPAFIRRPFILRGIMNGLAGALISIGLFSLTLYYLNQYFPEMLQNLPKEYILLLFAAKILLGIFISWISTIFAVSKYLRLKTSDLYF